ncbi:RNA-binding protein 5-like isoform X2 [Drosophila nasuta]|uniref:RNA-binding protein 5-like isoform X2 n=1 Tax=Drosophila nasuta TaxID=42062 RepID=UPI00295E494D|nr:RNA-binding protein 5-like isoform X2 [Drosophila nasuta]
MSARNMDSHSRYGRSFSGGGNNAGGSGGGGGNNSGNQYRRQYSRSRSRSRERSREQAGYRRRNSRSRSRERSSQHHYRNAGSADKDLYRDLINDDYNEERGGSSYISNYNNSSRSNNNYHHRRDDSSERDRDRERDRERDRDRDRERDRERDRDRDQRWKHYDREPRERNSDFDRGSERSRDYRSHNNGNGNNALVSTNRDRDRRYSSDEESYDSDESDDSQYRRNNVRTSNEALNQIIIFGLKKHITEADIMGALIQVNMEPSSIRLIRKRPTGASRGFAFVEFNTVEEATRWMELTQGNLKLGDQRVFLQYSHKRITDWHCIKCGVYNFKRRFSCFMCMASRAESESIYTGGGEGIDEVSPILTKKIMLRNLDALTTEESVLTALQKVLPKLAKTISKVLISRDALTQTSRGFCYLEFETLVDSMDVHNALTALETPLRIDERDVCISYCNDAESNQAVSKDAQDATGQNSMHGALAAVPPSDAGGEYTLADVPRLAEYSASLYASTPAEHAHYVQYYTDYYVAEIKKGGQLGGGGTGEAQVTEANSGAAVALSAIQRKQKKMNSIETTATAAASAAAQAAAAVKASFAAQTVVAPRGNDGKTYPTPDVSRYQYDETSGYYYDPSTGLYYDAHSQYYYNNETGAYLYWDQRRSTYILATPASTQAALQETLAQEAAAAAAEQKEEDKKDKKDNSNKHDKVKVAKKIVKDMEKWAKQLNQKKDYTVVATPQPILPGRGDPGNEAPSTSRAAAGGAYADVGFSILEKKERGKLSDYVPQPTPINKLVNAYGGGSDSEEDNSGSVAAAAAGGGGGGAGGGTVDEMDYVDFQKLTCLLCKRAFQSHDILQKHLRMSNLHKENLAKLNVAGSTASVSNDDAGAAGLSYRDRAKERRLKYGEGDPPPPNRSRERFEHEIKNLQTRQKDGGGTAPAMPISSNNVGNRLLQKMGWSEGQGLGRKNQGRTQIIEAEARSNNIGLGNKSGTLAPGDDYKTYIKKMMKSRYENA